MLNSRKLEVASQCITLIGQLQTKLAALEMNHEIEILKAVRDSVEREICRLCNGGGDD